MNKIILSLLIMSTIVLFSACGNNKQAMVDGEKNTIIVEKETNNDDISKSIEIAGEYEDSDNNVYPKRFVETYQFEGEFPLFMGIKHAGIADHVTQSQEKDGKTKRVMKLSNGYESVCYDDKKIESPTTATMKTVCHEQKGIVKSFTVIKLAKGKKYIKKYKILPDGTKLLREDILTKNNDGTATQETVINKL